MICVLVIIFYVCGLQRFFFSFGSFLFFSRKEKKKRTIVLVNMCLICVLCIMPFFYFLLCIFLLKKYLAKSAK